MRGECGTPFAMSDKSLAFLIITSATDHEKTTHKSPKYEIRVDSLRRKIVPSFSPVCFLSNYACKKTMASEGISESGTKTGTTQTFARRLTWNTTNKRKKIESGKKVFSLFFLRFFCDCRRQFEDIMQVAFFDFSPPISIPWDPK